MLNSPGIGGLGQTIAIMDQSGKVMSTSRHLMNLFSDAKQAYRDRKAELRGVQYVPVGPPRPRLPRRAYTVDEQSVNSSRRETRHRHHHHDSKSRHRRHSNSPTRPPSHPDSGATLPRERGLDSSQHRGPPHVQSPPATSPGSPFPPSPGAAAVPPSLVPHVPGMSVMRRASLPMAPLAPRRSLSRRGIDPDLAYGEVPPGLFEQERHEDAELKGLVGRARGLLDEANCLQYSVTQTMQRLQQNPDAMAAVALTLAEISNLVKKMSPGALMQIRRMAPAVFGLLSSPQFLVAVGVGVGVTIVAFGGYKIVRRIQANRAAETEAEELMEIRADVSRIETWRRGVAQSEPGSLGTSVEGEFISPTALRLKALTLKDEPARGASKSQARGENSRSRRATASTVRTKSGRSTRASSTTRGSVKSGGSSHSKSTRNKTVATKDENPRRRRPRASMSEAKSKPSPLRLMFGSS